MDIFWGVMGHIRTVAWNNRDIVKREKRLKESCEVKHNIVRHTR